MVHRFSRENSGKAIIEQTTLHITERGSTTRISEYRRYGSDGALQEAGQEVSSGAGINRWQLRRDGR
jgi:hypothetical protein